MVQEQLVKDSVDNGATPKMGLALQLRIVMRFFTIWLSSLAVLVVIALLSNIEWARKHVETALNQSFHRQVRLGRLSWSFGLQGLALDSDRFEMKDRDGSPFVTSGPAEIGIAFLPLLQKRLVIKHLQFNRPEVWASKIDEKNWNFSDLLTEGPEIRMVRIEDGRLHLHNLQTRKPIQTSSNSDSNAQNTANGDAQDGKSTPSAKEIEDIEGSWKTYDIQDIKLSVTMPKKNRNWPVFL